MKRIIFILLAILAMACADEQPKELRFNRITVYLCHDERNYGLAGKSRTLASDNTFRLEDGEWQCINNTKKDYRQDSIRLVNDSIVCYLDHGRLQIIYSNEN